MNYVKIKAEKIRELFWSKEQAINACNLIIEALDDIECDENHNVMESINEEERFYNDVIREIDAKR